MGSRKYINVLVLLLLAGGVTWAAKPVWQHTRKALPVYTVNFAGSTPTAAELTNNSITAGSLVINGSNDEFFLIHDSDAPVYTRWSAEGNLIAVSIQVTSNIVANGDIVGDGSTVITNVLALYFPDGSSVTGTPSYACTDGAGWSGFAATQAVDGAGFAFTNFTIIDYFNFTIPNDGNWNSEAYPIWQAPDNGGATLLELWVGVGGVAATSITYNLDERPTLTNTSGTVVFTNNITATTAGLTSVNFSNDTFTANYYVFLTTPSSGSDTGTVDVIHGRGKIRRTVE